MKRNHQQAPTGGVVMKTKPFKYQRSGIWRMKNRYRGRSLNADDVGLGKSIQALYASIPFRRKRPILVVCPSPIKLGWEAQVREHTNLTCQILKTRTPPKGGIQRPADVLIINWEILQFWVNTLKKMKVNVIILDEVHMAKNPHAKRTKAVREVCKGIDCVYCLSGTPIENCPVEFFVPLNILRPDVFDNFRKFAHRYSIPRYTHWGIKFQGARNKKELNRKLRKYVMVRRTKRKVLKDLPPLIRSVVPLDIDMRKYKAAEKDITHWLLKNRKHIKKGGGDVIGGAKLSHLLQVVAELKFKSVCEWIENFLETTDKKLTVFAHHRQFLEKLNNKFKKNSVLVYGGISGEKRRSRIKEFVKRDDIRIFFGGITAVGTGVNDLQLASSDMAIVELYWVGLKLLQVEGRLDRIGQKHQVNVNYLVAFDTVEQILCNAIIRKQRDVNSVVDARYSRHEFEVFNTVMKRLLKRVA